MDILAPILLIIVSLFSLKSYRKGHKAGYKLGYLVGKNLGEEEIYGLKNKLKWAALEIKTTDLLLLYYQKEAGGRVTSRWVG